MIDHELLWRLRCRPLDVPASCDFVDAVRAGLGAGGAMRAGPAWTTPDSWPHLNGRGSVTRAGETRRATRAPSRPNRPPAYVAHGEIPCR